MFCPPSPIASKWIAKAGEQNKQEVMSTQLRHSVCRLGTKSGAAAAALAVVEKGFALRGSIEGSVC